MTKASSDAELVASLARLWPNREHKAIAVAGLLCRVGIHYWRLLDLAELAPNRDYSLLFLVLQDRDRRNSTHTLSPEKRRSH